MTQEEEGPAPEVNGLAEEVEEKEVVKEVVKLEQVKEKEVEETNTSAKTEVLLQHLLIFYTYNLTLWFPNIGSGPKSLSGSSKKFKL